MGLRTIFMGTPELAAASLEALLRSPDAEVIAAVTPPDQPKGRGLKRQPSPVRTVAQREHLPVLQPASARDEQHLQHLRALQPDLIVVAAYGRILPQSILDLPRYGCLNVHTSLLPKYRGAAPIQWAILNGDTITGVTIMRMDAGLDTGAIIATAETPIRPADNSDTLHDRLAILGAELLVNTIPAYVAGNIPPRPQPADGVSYAPKITKEDGHINWQQPARAIWNRVRALIPWPGAFTHLPGALRSSLLKIWTAEVREQRGRPGEILEAGKAGITVGCGQDALRILLLQREGGRRMSAAEFLAGHPLRPGQTLGSG